MPILKLRNQKYRFVVPSDSGSDSEEEEATPKPRSRARPSASVALPARSSKASTSAFVQKGKKDIPERRRRGIRGLAEPTRKRCEVRGGPAGE